MTGGSGGSSPRASTAAGFRGSPRASTAVGPPRSTRGFRCMLIWRGGTSKGLFFLVSDLPADQPERDAILLAIMGSGHPMQVDGVGGAHPLASKVALVSPSSRPDADIDYLFLQLGVEEATVTALQNCGNILAGVGQFAAERGLVIPGDPSTTVRIHMLNSGSVVTATFATPEEFPSTSAARPSLAFPAAPHLSCCGSPTRRARRRGACCPPVTYAMSSPASRSPAWTTACRWSSPAPPISASPGTRRIKTWRRTRS